MDAQWTLSGRSVGLASDEDRLHQYYSTTHIYAGVSVLADCPQSSATFRRVVDEPLVLGKLCNIPSCLQASAVSGRVENQPI